MTEEDFYQYLEEYYGFTIQYMEKDGNCLYSAISTAMFGDSTSQWVIRDELSEYLRVNHEQYRHFFTDDEGYAREVHRTATNTFWGGELQIRIASDYYQRNIEVYTAGGYPIYYEGNANDNDIIRLTFFVNHYNLITGNPRVFTQIKKEENASDKVESKEIEIKTEVEYKLMDIDKDLVIRPSESEGGIQQDENNGNNEYGPIYNIDEVKEATSCNGDEIDVKFDFIDDRENLNNNDHQAHNIYEGSEHSDNITQAQITQKVGYNFFAAKAYQSGRKFVYMLFLTPKEYIKNTLAETILNVAGNDDIYFTISYRRQIHESLLTDIEVNDVFNIWISKKTFPLDNTTTSIRTWYCMMMIPYVLMTVIQQKWKHNTFKFLFFPGKDCLVHQLLLGWWIDNKNEIMRDMDYILEQPDSLFCEKCTYDCPVRQKPWHINLYHFKRQESPNDYWCIFKKLNTINDMPNEPSALLSNAIHELIDIYQSSQVFEKQDQLSRVYQVLNDANAKVDQYNSYLLLIVDGPHMTQDTEFRDVEHDPSYVKSLYAGQTYNGDFRQDHFNKKSSSPISTILSKTSKVYLLRSKKFRTRHSATIDEAIVITTLSLTLETAKQNGKIAPYVLLNKRSENSQLFNLRQNVQSGILEFCQCENAIFTSDKNKSSTEDANGSFKGNCYVGVPLNVPTGVQEFSLDLYSNFLKN